MGSLIYLGGASHVGACLPRYLWRGVVEAALKSDSEFRAELERAMRELGIGIRELSRMSGVSESLLYKVLSGSRSDIRVSTLRKIIRAIRRAEGVSEEPFLAIIAARPTLNSIDVSQIKVGGRTIRLKEYAAATIEEILLAAIRAEEDGAAGIVCAPVVSNIVARVARIPVVSCPVELCKHPIMRAVEIAARKLFPG
ncbi:MAG: transcriptional regulator [Thermoproteota archaeon]|nr:MAG: transcriptional regulator [Candidatus Korarchaeota archaeon]